MQFCSYSLDVKYHSWKTVWNNLLTNLMTIIDFAGAANAYNAGGVNVGGLWKSMAPVNPDATHSIYR